MIQMMTAYTEEVDEVEDGIAEILEQLDLGALKKHSIGLITCHYDFTSAGFIDALCKNLPFDVIGMTTMASANQHGRSMYALSLTVLTSDEVIFEAVMSGALGPDNYHEQMEAAYSDSVKNLPGKPSLIITFFPYLYDLSGALMHRAFDEVCGGIPFWGSLATNSDVSYEHCNVFRNGDVTVNGMVMILLHGPVDPEFYVVSIPTQNIRKDRGKITDSEGCLLKKIDGIPAWRYMENRGVEIMKDASITTPLMVYYEGSAVPVALAIYTVNDDGSLLCGGEMPTGASVAVGEITNEGILTTAEEGMNRVIKCGKKSGALFLPCVTRYVMLVPDHDGELKLVENRLENGSLMTFMAGYSGGEVCPVQDESGALQNRFHNFTFSALVF
ncbi:MAG: FIST C-terminal domain-containing protein [Treponema sp.]|nr:FIST C-terminal domain-containing protein [Treponema sp.]